MRNHLHQNSHQSPYQSPYKSSHQSSHQSSHHSSHQGSYQTPNQSPYQSPIQYNQRSRRLKAKTSSLNLDDDDNDNDNGNAYDDENDADDENELSFTDFVFSLKNQPQEFPQSTTAFTSSTSSRTPFSTYSKDFMETLPVPLPVLLLALVLTFVGVVELGRMGGGGGLDYTYDYRTMDPSSIVVTYDMDYPSSLVTDTVTLTSTSTSTSTSISTITSDVEGRAYPARSVLDSWKDWDGSSSLSTSSLHTFGSSNSNSNSRGQSFLPLRHFQFTKRDQRKFLVTNGDKCLSPHDHEGTTTLPLLVDAFDRFHSKGFPRLSSDVWKYCFLYLHGGTFVDHDTLPTHWFFSAVSEPKSNVHVNVNVHLNTAVWALDKKSIHDGFLSVTELKSNVARGMINMLQSLSQEEGLSTISSNSVPDTLYDLIQMDNKDNNKRWKLLEMRCQDIQELHLPRHKDDNVDSRKFVFPQNVCPIFGAYCCSIVDGQRNGQQQQQQEEEGDYGNGMKTPVSSLLSHEEPLLLTKHPLPPSDHIKIPSSMKEVPLPYKYAAACQDGTTEGCHDHLNSSSSLLPSRQKQQQQQQQQQQQHLYVATIREVVYSTTVTRESSSPTRMFDFLFENDCLPTDRGCHKCLRSSNPSKGSCANCFQYCQCYCRVLCKIRPPPMFVSKDYWIRPPVFRKDPARIIPRIVHQTWWEPVTKESYPNMSRLIESWKRSGWEYHFYDDDASSEFLSTHFPVEVKEAYDALLPGAFRADLFRYCVLLIRGGVYADMDVLLESNLDHLVPPDVGFLTPIDEPGMHVDHRMCLWNGLLAVAPGHPILARVIELTVNNIRNRFTSVDYDDMLCPDPVLSVSHMVDMLFTTGPCILGAAFNDVLGRHMQTQVEVGNYDIHTTNINTNSNIHTKSKQLPGRTVILEQNREDMGSHRFTSRDMNAIVAATDLKDYDDRPEQESKHYSKTRVKAGIYGLSKLYRDNRVANEVIRIYIEY